MQIFLTTVLETFHKMIIYHVAPVASQFRVRRTERLGVRLSRYEREPFHPRTPVKTRKTSRRRWDSAIKHWRIHLHYWNE